MQKLRVEISDAASGTVLVKRDDGNVADALNDVTSAAAASDGGPLRLRIFTNGICVADEVFARA